MFQAIHSSDEIDVTPCKGQSQKWLSIVYIVFIFIMVFFVLHMFVSVIIEKFQQETDKFEGTWLLNDKQKDWTLAIRFMLEAQVLMQAKPPKNCFRRLFYRLVQHEWFEKTLTFMICLNIIVLCVDYYRANQILLNSLEIINIFFVVLFAFEAFAKITGLGLKFYFKSNDNIFDFFIVRFFRFLCFIFF